MKSLAFYFLEGKMPGTMLSEPQPAFSSVTIAKSLGVSPSVIGKHAGFLLSSKRKRQAQCCQRCLGLFPFTVAKSLDVSPSAIGKSLAFCLPEREKLGILSRSWLALIQGRQPPALKPSRIEALISIGKSPAFDSQHGRNPGLSRLEKSVLK